MNMILSLHSMTNSVALVWAPCRTFGYRYEILICRVPSNTPLACIIAAKRNVSLVVLPGPYGAGSN